MDVKKIVMYIAIIVVCCALCFFGRDWIRKVIHGRTYAEATNLLNSFESDLEREREGNQRLREIINRHEERLGRYEEAEQRDELRISELEDIIRRQTEGFAEETRIINDIEAVDNEIRRRLQQYEDDPECTDWYYGSSGGSSSD